MKYFIFSDLHGSIGALTKTMEAIDRERPDLILCLGDILHGAYDGNATKAAKMFHEIKVPILAVAGNCDYASDEDILPFDLPSNRAIDIGMRTMHISHRPMMLAFPSGDIALNGHTHVKCLYKDGGVIRCNPGSVALPRDGVASYAVFEHGEFRLVDLESGETLSRLSI